MRIRVIHLAVVVSLVMCTPMSRADSDLILKRDYLFIHAQLIGCGSMTRTVEVGEVSDSGEVTFFNDLTLKAENKTVEDFTNEFVKAWEEQTGQQSKTIQIKRESDPQLATMKMLLLYQERKRGCGSDPLDFESPNWRDYIHFAESTTHNKSFKPAPAGLDAHCVRAA